ncbi:oxidoreductase [Alkalihalobacillus alcalophilus ATCC 27647 = CGMCC 1.3604]|uniref:Oxidoreductase n=1 Tax=Alkalihalobacillus alcalophilus ATCC 27647 = CGMCC 1.3604 TaxID=1218173 RepID=A0A094WL78_ALKAL|nr:FAD-dependent oxidoreductase [Alkalihalobacillus alcalophilus]KGA96688.1 oxidoreductase [Alkalihalobacillus alcalophilus ATCC 27647 = CGMCC 1.3604]MED1562380.1 FAD-dependent oxidoreductase [Alkalihalobacillus alcalophilus]THG89388.1 oxidoreductase [Alkalihalobacillus alcalophilus ATCC 27647 = CGMCC 1.3604]
MKKHYVIIGAGILGASTAYHLARKGEKVTIIDRNDQGKATNVAAGIVSPWLSQRRNKAWYQLAKNGAAYYPKLIKQLEKLGETDTGYQQVGVLNIHPEEKRIDKLLSIAKERKVNAPEMGELKKFDQDQIVKRFPLLTEPLFAAFATGGARVDGYKICLALIRVALKMGANMIEGDAKLFMEGGQVAGVCINDKVIKADEIIVTTGAWGQEVLLPLGVHFQVKPQKAQILELAYQNQNSDRWPVVMAPGTLYLLAFEKGRLVVGTTHEDDTGFDTRPTAGAIHEILTKAFEHAPNLQETTVVETKVGFRPVVPHSLPVIGRLSKFMNVLVANGLGSSGLTVGPYLGKELAKLALNEPLEIDLENYKLETAIQE